MPHMATPWTYSGLPFLHTRSSVSPSHSTPRRHTAPDIERSEPHASLYMISPTVQRREDEYGTEKRTPSIAYICEALDAREQLR